MATAAGHQHSLALQSDGTVFAWGDNRFRQLGDGTTTQREIPVQVSGLSGVVAIAGGSQQSVVLKGDGTVWAWGNNSAGQLGDGTTSPRESLVQVSGLNGVVAIATGQDHSLAVKSDGTVFAWGSNGDGQLGDGTTTQRETPVQVSGLNGVVAIAAGDTHSLAVKSDGTVFAWGFNGSGRLGDGTTTKREIPVQVSEFSGVVAVAGGAKHSLGVKSDGTVFAWGENGSGQLGDGSTFRDRTNHLTPFQVSGLSGVVAVAAGGGHSLAVGIMVNVTPTVNSITVPPDPVSIAGQSSFIVDVSYTDPGGVNDEPYTCDFDLDNDGVNDSTVSGVTGTSCSTPLNYLEPGVYTVKVTVTDKHGGSGSAVATELIVIFGPAEGFATGGGWIIPGGNTSEDGDDLPGLDNSSKASFGFVVKYKKGANTPGGQLEFQYRVGDFNLHGSDYDWLFVTNNNRAKFQGVAAINGAQGLFPFKVDARDGDASATTLPDRFVIKIWAAGADPDADEPLYKASGDLGGGQIIIHSGK